MTAPVANKTTVIAGLTLATGLAITSPLPAAGTITGKAEIVDGDTLVVGRVRIRLYGIDAPEAGQKCKRDNGKPWNGGQAAIEALVQENQYQSRERRAVVLL